MDLSNIETRLVDLTKRKDLKLPAYPAVLGRVTRIIGKHEYTIGELVQAVQSDQALTAAVLRYASSARVAASAAIAQEPSLDRAIKLIGARELVRCALAGSLGAGATAPGPLVSLRHRVWKEALLSAHLCQELATLRGLPDESAFLVGLLHDFGKIVLMAAIEHREARCPAMPARQWLDLLERYHVGLGEHVAQIWKLPPLVIDVIGAHHAPATGRKEIDQLVELINIADLILEVCESHTSVRPDDLMGVAALSPAERARMAAALPRVAAIVASFARPAVDQPSPSVSWVEPGAPPPPREQQQVANVTFTVTCERREGPIVFFAQSIDWQGLRVTGKRALPENTLEKVTLGTGDRKVTLLANVVSCAARDGEYFIELRPFGLDGNAKNDYNKLVRICLDAVAAHAARKTS